MQHRLSGGGRVSNSVCTNKQNVAKIHLAGCFASSKKWLIWQRKRLQSGCIVMTMKGTGEQRVVGDGYCVRGKSTLPVLWSRWASTLLGPVSLVLHLPSQSSEPREQEENIWSFCAPIAGCCGIFLTESGYLLNCFPHRLVCCEALLLLCILAGFQGLRNAFWRAAVGMCPQCSWIFSGCVCVCGQCIHKS